ncbi:family 20 glycosylhydrolase [Sandaracinobacter sp. RS1-74]|uniref:beta-N-acetylhexosaminidase n=1 Tax=Sandaracinobacteroides sayramensis TaxID=2913411 RepID=UPI001EDB6D86|nr:family 20 glycosylhydrolase [Sandaracinobacteroides sayramensis]MCG2842104.1 family 20 glycosylhydrolase [Sandaracinobacteroides sayramensis]
MRFAFLLLSFLVAFAVRAAEAEATPKLLPQPSSMQMGEGFFRPSADERVAVVDDGSREAASRFIALVEQSGGPRLSFHSTGRIRFLRDPAVSAPEGYRLTVTPERVEVRASTDAGLYYGGMTLWQLLQGGRIPALVIDDKPEFGWRGLMIDSARHFQPPEEIQALIVRMGQAKLNRLHWHLTDDQGWRLPIAKHPELTSIGGCRRPAGAAGTDAQGQPVRYCGHYSREDIRDIIATAAAHHVTIVPEVDVPGHATAAIAALPKLASTPTPPTEPSAYWGILPNLFNTEDASFALLKDVVDELVALFPGPYIHMGGDEAVKDQWKADPRAQARIKALGLKDETALQGWYMARVGAYVEAHGRRMIGWDEILDGGVPADAIVMSWRGIDGAITAARSGHDTVLSPAPILYLDHRQSASAHEPPGRGEIVTWKRLHGFDPAPAQLTPEQRRHILGLQANMWTEHARTPGYRQRMIWPRALVVAELGWSPPAGDWAEFGPRLLARMQRDKALGHGFNETPLAPLAALSTDGRAFTVELSQPAEIGTLRHTLDGSPVTPDSAPVAGPIRLDRATEVRARAFLGSEPAGPESRFEVNAATLRNRHVADMELCSNKLPLRLEDDGETDGERRILWGDIMQTCWMWRQAPVGGMARVAATVGSVPYNFSLGDDMRNVTFAAPKTPAGELEIRLGDCEGRLLASLPLAPAVATRGLTRLEGAIEALPGPTADLCLRFTQKAADPLWMIERLELK